MNNLFDLKGKVAVVTGGYGHLGNGMVRALAKFNATVIVAGRSEEKFNNTFTNSEKIIIKFKTIDIAQTTSINIFFNTVYAEYGKIDVLVNNAMASKGNSQENMSDEDWAFTMDGVLGSAHKCIRAVIPIMKKQQSGKIINIASMYGLVSPDFNVYKGGNCEKYTNPPHYGAAKAAMVQLTKYYAVLLGKHNIYVNAISPGPFPSKAVQEQNPVFINRLMQKNPLNKIGKPEDLAGIIVLLSSSASDFITGQVIQVDGGWTAW